MRNSKMKGFTLIELIVVIAIIGVLAAILVPSMLGYVGDSKLATANSNAKLVHTNSMTYATKCETAGYPMNKSASLSEESLRNDDPTNTAVKAPTSSSDIDLATALQALMGSASDSSGVCSVQISAAGTPTDSAWAKTTDDVYVGTYPDEATSKNENKISGALTITTS